MVHARPMKLDRVVNNGRDHVLGNADAPITLVEYGSYACPHCHAVHEVIADLRDRLGDRMRYVFRHRPFPERDGRARGRTGGICFGNDRRILDVHDALMKQGPSFTAEISSRSHRTSNCRRATQTMRAAWKAAVARVGEDFEARSAAAW